MLNVLFKYCSNENHTFQMHQKIQPNCDRRLKRLSIRMSNHFSWSFLAEPNEPIQVENVVCSSARALNSIDFVHF